MPKKRISIWRRLEQLRLPTLKDKKTRLLSRIANAVIGGIASKVLEECSPLVAPPGIRGKISVRMDGTKNRIVRFDADQMRHFDHGYAVTSHSSQGLTAERVLVNMDTEVHPKLINNRFAYLSVFACLARRADLYQRCRFAHGESQVRM